MWAGTSRKEVRKMAIELKPCPFCGGEANVFVSFEGGVFVICMKCQTRTKTLVDFPKYNKPTNAVDKVIEAWNRRVNNGKA